MTLKDSLCAVGFGLLCFLGACGGSGSGGAAISATPTTPQVASPTVTMVAEQNGAVLVKLATTTPSAKIYYTTDGSTPTASAQRYEAPFLVASNLTVKAIAVSAGYLDSTTYSQAFSPNIASGSLVWSDEFNGATTAAIPPDALVWTYDTGDSGFGNHELETYCTPTSTTAPCDATSPNAYVGTDGLLHVVARKSTGGQYTSARLKSQGLFSFQYGRLEVRVRVPEAQGLWPAVWTLGNNINTVDWPASGEQDIVERVNAASTPDWNEGSLHGTGFTGTVGLGTLYHFPAGQTANGWHTYGMIWKPGSVAYYIDDVTSPYVTYTTSNLNGLPGALWPFDAGQSNFLLVNLAVGGDWPGSPDATTPFPSEMQVDYIRLYTN